MSLHSWFARREHRGSKSASGRRRPTVHLDVEQLENRLVPAAISTIASLPPPPPALGAVGAWPGNLIEDSHGDLFGSTVFGGTDGVFELVNHNGSYVFQIIYSGGFSPQVIDANGDLFGTIAGANDVWDGTDTVTGGAVCELVNHNGSYTLQTLYSFTNGSGPGGGLFVDARGDIFGALNGGVNVGSYYELVNQNGSYTLQTFNSITAVANAGGAGLFSDGHGHYLVFTDGNDAPQAYGTLEQLINTNGSFTLQPVYTFTDASGYNANGIFPWDVVEDANGNFFGITEANSDRTDAGCAFELVNDNGSYTLQILHSFSGGTDGASPYSLVMDANGNLIGATCGGGINNNGTLFELVKTNASYSFQTLYSFTGGADGSFPNDLIEDDQGNIFGVTEYGDGTQSGGTVFEIPAGSGDAGKYANYVSNLYQDLLHRPGDAAGLAYWAGQLDAGVPASTVVQDFEQSPEYRNDLVNSLYKQYLQRNADPAGLAAWTGLLASGGSVEQVAAGIVSSPEYFHLHGSSNAGFVSALYQEILGRNGSSAEVQSWVNALQRETRSQVAMGFLTSTEYRTDLVDSYYTEFLGRPADPAGQTAWVEALASGMSDTSVLAAMLGSAEAQTRLS